MEKKNDATTRMLRANSRSGIHLQQTLFSVSPFFRQRRPGVRLSAQCGSRRKDGLPVGGVGIHDLFLDPTLSQPRICRHRITVQMATHSRSNAVPILQGDNELTGPLLHRPRLLMSFSFLRVAKLQCCALRVGVLRACGPHQKRPCMSPRPPPGAIRFKCIPGEQGCRLLRVSCSCNSIEVSCRCPFISSDTARESCRLMTGLVFGHVLSPDKSPVAGPKCRRPGRM